MLRLSSHSPSRRATFPFSAHGGDGSSSPSTGEASPSPFSDVSSPAFLRKYSSPYLGKQSTTPPTAKAPSSRSDRNQYVIDLYADVDEAQDAVDASQNTFLDRLLAEEEEVDHNVVVQNEKSPQPVPQHHPPPRPMTHPFEVMSEMAGDTSADVSVASVAFSAGGGSVAELTDASTTRTMATATLLQGGVRPLQPSLSFGMQAGTMRNSTDLPPFAPRFRVSSAAISGSDAVNLRRQPDDKRPVRTGVAGEIHDIGYQSFPSPPPLQKVERVLPFALSHEDRSPSPDRPAERSPVLRGTTPVAQRAAAAAATITPSGSSVQLSPMSEAGYSQRQQLDTNAFSAALGIPETVEKQMAPSSHHTRTTTYSPSPKDTSTTHSTTGTISSAFFSLTPYLERRPLVAVDVEYQTGKYGTIHIFADDDSAEELAMRFIQKHHLDMDKSFQPLTHFLRTQLPKRQQRERERLLQRQLSPSTTTPAQSIVGSDGSRTGFEAHDDTSPHVPQIRYAYETGSYSHAEASSAPQSVAGTDGYFDDVILRGAKASTASSSLIVRHDVARGSGARREEVSLCMGAQRLVNEFQPAMQPRQQAELSAKKRDRSAVGPPSVLATEPHQDRGEQQPIRKNSYSARTNPTPTTVSHQSATVNTPQEHTNGIQAQRHEQARTLVTAQPRQTTTTLLRRAAVLERMRSESQLALDAQQQFTFKPVIASGSERLIRQNRRGRSVSVASNAAAIDTMCEQDNSARWETQESMRKDVAAQSQKTTQQQQQQRIPARSCSAPMRQRKAHSTSHLATKNNVATGERAASAAKKARVVGDDGGFSRVQSATSHLSDGKRITVPPSRHSSPTQRREGNVVTPIYVPPPPRVAPRPLVRKRDASHMRKPAVPSVESRSTSSRDQQRRLTELKVLHQQLKKENDREEREDRSQASSMSASRRAVLLQKCDATPGAQAATPSVTQASKVSVRHRNHSDPHQISPFYIHGDRCVSAGAAAPLRREQNRRETLAKQPNVYQDVIEKDAEAPNTSEDNKLVKSPGCYGQSLGDRLPFSSSLPTAESAFMKNLYAIYRDQTSARSMNAATAAVERVEGAAPSTPSRGTLLERRSAVNSVERQSAFWRAHASALPAGLSPINANEKSIHCSPFLGR